METLFYIIILIISYLFCLFLEFRRNSCFIVLWMGLGLIFYLPIIIDLIFQYKSYKYTTYQHAVYFALFFNLFYFLIRLIFGRKITYSLEIKHSKINKIFLWACNLCLIFSVIGVLVYYVISGISITTVTWADKHALGTPINIMTYFYYFGCMSLFLSFLMKNKVVLITSLVFIIIFIVLTQSRAIIIPAIVPFLIYILIYKKKILTFSLIALGSVLFFFLLQQIRYANGLNNFFNTSPIVILENTKDKILSKDNEFALINAFYEIIERPYSLTRYGEFITFKRMLLVFYPDPINRISHYYQIKPLDFTSDIYTHYYGYKKGTFHPTFYGLIYANAGFYFGILSAIFFGLIISVFDHIFNYLVKNNKIIIYFCVLIACCHMSLLWARGSIYVGWSQGLFMITTSILMLFLIKRILFQ